MTLKVMAPNRTPAATSRKLNKRMQCNFFMRGSSLACKFCLLSRRPSRASRAFLGSFLETQNSRFLEDRCPEVVNGRDIGERSDAILRTAMPGDDERGPEL